MRLEHFIALDIKTKLESKIPSSSSILLSIHLSLCLCKTDGIFTEVIDRVPSAKESISQDSQWAGGFGEVHAHEGRNARSLYFQNVVEWSDGEVVAAEVEGQIWEAVTLVALDRVLAIVTFLGANLLVQ